MSTNHTKSLKEEILAPRLRKEMDKRKLLEALKKEIGGEAFETRKISCRIPVDLMIRIEKWMDHYEECHGFFPKLSDILRGALELFVNHISYKEDLFA